MKKLILCLVISLLLISCSSNSWAFEFVQINGVTYVITDEIVEQEEVGELLGEVDKYSDEEKNHSSSYSGNFSNIYKIGTELYEIKGISRAHAIVVEYEIGHYVKAINEEEWTEEN
ncbi:hypothetical protein [Alkalihalobacillus sp. 1P02AB]|uniref:hypothetical protein n=1 Tax=Alkalihalobacillus sp. 1P02AB TaxID=3132260 RepID=UPI0039A635D7